MECDIKREKLLIYSNQAFDEQEDKDDEEAHSKNFILSSSELLHTSKDFSYL